MRLTPKPLEIGPKDGFTKENDIFGYRDFGEQLANLVCAQEGPATLVFDSPWGTGKSTFMRQWAGLLRREQGVTVIEFDAFENDYQEDAFVALAGEIAGAIGAGETGDMGTRRERYVEAAKNVAGLVSRFTLGAGVKFATAGAVNLQELEDLLGEAKEALKAAGGSGGADLGQLMEERLNQAQGQRTELEAFRRSLEELAAGLREADHAGPLVFIVDELDRCRPIFALGVVERIKHLFSVDGVVFVLVTNMAQLGKVVQSVYGIDEPHAYLEKFVDLRVTLPTQRRSSDSVRTSYLDYFWKIHHIAAESADLTKVIFEGIARLSEIHRLSLRTIERVSIHTALFFAATERKVIYPPSIVVGLCVMRQIYPELYQEARTGTLTWDRAQKIVRPHGRSRSQEDDEGLDFSWRFVTELNIPREAWAANIREHLPSRYCEDPERSGLLPDICGMIDQLTPLGEDGPSG